MAKNLKFNNQVIFSKYRLKLMNCYGIFDEFTLLSKNVLVNMKLLAAGCELIFAQVP